LGAKSGQTVELLLDRDDNVEFGAQLLILMLLSMLVSGGMKNMMKYAKYTLIY